MFLVKLIKEGMYECLKRNQKWKKKSVVISSVIMSTAYRKVHDPTYVCSMTRK
jgi:hypothetical protein